MSGEDDDLVINRKHTVRAGWVTHNKAKAFLQVDIPDASVAFEEPLHILLPGRGAKAADEDATPAHVDDVTCERAPIRRGLRSAKQREEEITFQTDGPKKRVKLAS